MIVLLLGVGFKDACTCFHLAEHRLPTPAPRRLFRCYVLENSRKIRREFMAPEADDSDFGRLGAAMAARAPFVHRGRVGRTTACWFPLNLPTVDSGSDSAWMSGNAAPARQDGGVKRCGAEAGAAALVGRPR